MAERERLRRIQVLGDRFPDGQLLQREQPGEPIASSGAARKSLTGQERSVTTVGLRAACPVR